MLKCTIVEGDGERRKEFELTLFADGRSIIKGTNDAAVARKQRAPTQQAPCAGGPPQVLGLQRTPSPR